MAHDLIRRVATLGNPRILVVGDLILDRYVWGYAERISQEAPVPLLRADHREHRLGGAASVATMLRALEAEVALVGAVGVDAEAGLVRRLLRAMGIDDQSVLTLEDRPTTSRISGRSTRPACATKATTCGRPATDARPCCSSTRTAPTSCCSTSGCRSTMAWRSLST